MKRAMKSFDLDNDGEVSWEETWDKFKHAKD